MIRFVWTRLIHAPHPNELVYIESYNTNYPIGVRVGVLVSVYFDSQSFSPNFSYKGRSIATPFLSTIGLENPAKDRRLLGNCVYSPIFTSFNSWSFKEIFTGTDNLGYYDFNSLLFDADKEGSLLSKKAVINYYVVNISGEKRISSFFNKYEQAESFARKLFMEPDEDENVKNFFMRPVVNSSIRSCIRRLKHPIGIFSYVRTMAGSINASELLFDFKKLLRHGGDT